MKMIDRKTKKIYRIKTSGILRFFYKTLLGRIILKRFANRRFANVVGKFMNTKFSLLFKNSLEKKLETDYYMYEKDDFTSYNDFFCRKIKDKYLKVNQNPKSFISPCDSKLTILRISDNDYFEVKRSKYRLHDLVDDDIINKYKNGYVLIFRLEVTDYHRYCYPVSGTRTDYTHIDGILHTVQPIVYDKYQVFHRNSREWCELNSKDFGKVLMIEVGAMCIGKITNDHEEKEFKKGDEKGHFEFGGSTIILVVKDKKVLFDKDIIYNSKHNLETIVKYGERIGVKWTR